MNSDQEIWKPIPDLPNYEASSLGRIRGPRGLHKLTVMPSGYVQACIKNKQYLVHRLVCSAFHGRPPFTGAKALHGPDHNKQNNTPSNLRWGDHKDNMRDMVQAGRQANTKLSRDHVKEIKFRYSQGESQVDLAQAFEVPQSTISNIVTGKSHIYTNEGWT